MNEQLSLPGFDPLPRLPQSSPSRSSPRRLAAPTDRLFFALFPSAEAGSRLTDLAQNFRAQYELRGKPHAVERFHITLNHLGDYVGLPQDLVDLAIKAGASVAAAPFEITLDHVMSFARSRNLPLVLCGTEGIVALMAFQQLLGKVMVRVGLGHKAEQSFTPHVTLLYDDKSVDTQQVEPIAWTACEFVLVHSLLGKPRHIPLARWPLRQQVLNP